MHINNPFVLVSVIVPVYNVAPFLKCCIDSVRNQIYSNLEIILVDDGSTDESGMLCDSFAKEDARIIIIRQHNCGLAAARNRGLDISRGKFIYFCDSDDWIRNDTIEKLVKHAENDCCDVVLFDAQVVEESGFHLQDDTRYVRLHEYPIMSGANAYCHMQKNNEYCCSACLIFVRKKILTKHEIRFPEGIIHEDQLFTFILLMKTKKVKHIYEKLYFRRVRSNSIMSAPKSIKNLTGYLKTIYAMEEYSKDISSESLRSVIINHILSLWSNCLDITAEIDIWDADSIDVANKLLQFGSENGFIKLDIDFNNFTRIIFYGAGKRCTYMLNYYSDIYYDEIWDKDVESIQILQGSTISISKPDFKKLKVGWCLIICIDNPQTVKEIVEQCHNNGFDNIYNWSTYYYACQLSKKLKEVL